MKLNARKVETFTIFFLLFLASMNFYAKFFYFAFASFIVLILFRGRFLVIPNVLRKTAIGYLLLSLLAHSAIIF